MRIISGEYGGRKLKAVPGKNTRPTTDKVKESLFNIIGPYFSGGICLDLFAGSGGLGIESVSRGMDQAVLVDRDQAAIKTIKENIQITKQPEKFRVYRNTADKALALLTNRQEAFDLVFLDPPYAKQTIVDQLERMLTGGLIAEGALVVCETDQTVELPDRIQFLKKIRKERYGITQVVIYKAFKDGRDEHE